MKTEEYYSGYFKTNGYKRKLIPISQDTFDLEIEAEHIYNKQITFDAYDVDGNFISKMTKKDRLVRREKRISNDYYNVVQIDYDFYRVPLGYINDQDSVIDTYNVLESLEGYVFECDYHKIESDCLFSSSENYRNRLYRQANKPIEINIRGCSLEITKNAKQSLVNGGLKNYSKNYKSFIDKYPDLKHSAEYLYESNTYYLSGLFMVKPKTIINGNFSIERSLLRRIDYNILLTQKQNKYETM